jgi:hypothetical protein
MLTYYEEIKDQLHDTNKDAISKADDISVEVKTEPDDFAEEELNKDMNDISVEVDHFKVSNEALENQVEVCNNEKVKTEPDEFEEEDKKPLEDIVEGERFNAYDVEKVKTQPEVQIWFELLQHQKH